MRATTAQIEARVARGADDEARVYVIVRVFADDRRPRVISRGHTEAEAQAHCGRADTRVAGQWFDAYNRQK